MPTHSQASLHEILASMESLLRRERELFGEALLVEPSGPVGAPEPMARPSHPPEPDLFGPPPAPTPSAPVEPWSAAETLDALDEMIHDCLRCPLGATRTKFVFGTGDPGATLMLIGEGPGADEDARGEPFVGRAGQLLNRILEAIRFRRDEVYICNIVKCRPPNNRKPESGEIDSCLPYLRKQIALVQPKVILCLGLTAAQSLLGTTDGLAKLRGRTMAYGTIPVMVTYHPAALLRNPNWKRPTWEDVQAARKLHDEILASGG